MTTITVPRVLLEQAIKAFSVLIASTDGDVTIGPYGVNLQVKAMNALRAALEAPATEPEQPAWHDAPTCAGMWVRVPPNGGVHLVDVYGVPHTPDAARWYGPIPEDKP